MALQNTHSNNYANNVDVAAKIFAEYSNFIRMVICYKVKNEAQVDDLFQDFFLFLVVSPLPAGVQNVKGYLYRMITNEVFKAARRVENYQNHMLKYAKRLNHSINKKTPENAFIEAEETKKMFELIERHLPRSYAQAITLRYRDNYDIKEVAKKMKLDRESARKYINRGFGRIRRFLTNMKTR